ncbi:MAG TPA: methyltransferase domain-containing protein [archaeon]|nr:methyltransferase domain-containing protein [archaeon]
MSKPDEKGRSPGSRVLSTGDSYQSLARYYDIFIDWENRLEHEIPFIIEAAGRRVSAPSALDIGCGTGYHLMALREARFSVSGTEPSEYLRALAVENLGGARIFSVPMEGLKKLASSHGPWHLVTCLGNTMAHLPADKLPGFCRALELALTPGGTAVLHVLGYEKIMARRPQGLPAKLVKAGETSYRFERRYEYLQDHIGFTVEIYENDILKAKDREILYPLTAGLLESSCTDAGFAEIRFFGAFSFRTPYTPESDNLVAVLRKRGSGLR